MPIRNTLACGDTCVLSRASLGFAAGPGRLPQRGLWLSVSFVGEMGHSTSATSTPCASISRRGEAEGGDVTAFPPSFPSSLGWSW